MIQAENINNQAIYVPRINTEIKESYVLTVTRGNISTPLTATSATELTDYRLLVFDFSNLKKGEYTYTLNTGESGLLRIGKIINSITAYTSNDQEKYTYYKG